MGLMKRLWFLLSFSGVLACSQDLSGVHTVYVLPMAHGLDQYLANRLTNERVFQVVTDPKRADAIFTDGIGKSFEEKLGNLLDNPEAAGSSPGDQPATSPLSGTVNKLENPATASTFARGKGTVFLVDPKTHHVLWSVYQPSRDSSSARMDRTASDIVSRLKRDLKSK